MGRKRKPQRGVYVFIAENGKELALVAGSTVPLNVREFLEMAHDWTKQALRESELLDKILEKAEDPNDLH